MYKTHREDERQVFPPDCFVIENKFVTLQLKIISGAKLRRHGRTAKKNSANCFLFAMKFVSLPSNLEYK